MPVPETTASASKASSPTQTASDEAASGIEVVQAEKAYVQQALASEEVNQAAVDEARKLLAAGQLDNSEACLRAAEAMLARGL